MSWLTIDKELYQQEDTNTKEYVKNYRSHFRLIYNKLGNDGITHLTTPLLTEYFPWKPYSCFSDIENFKNLTHIKLEDFSLCDEKSEILDFTKFEKLRFVKLEFTDSGRFRSRQQVKFNFSNLKHLEYVKINSETIYSIDFSGCENLKIVDLSDAAVTHKLDFTGCVNLEIFTMFDEDEDEDEERCVVDIRDCVNLKLLGVCGNIEILGSKKPDTHSKYISPQIYW